MSFDPPDAGSHAGRTGEHPQRACEILGLDPLYVANEGKLVAVTPPDRAETLVETLREHPLGRNAAVIGEILSDGPGLVRQKSRVGGERIVSLLAGEPLPRIC